MRKFTMLMVTAALAGVLASPARGLPVEWGVDEMFLANIENEINYWSGIGYGAPVMMTTYLFALDYSVDISSDLNNSILPDLTLSYDSINLLAGQYSSSFAGSKYDLVDDEPIDVFTLTILGWGEPDVNGKIDGVFLLIPDPIFGNPYQIVPGGASCVFSDEIAVHPASFKFTPPAIPEPATGLLTLAGAALFFAQRRRRK